MTELYKVESPRGRPPLDIIEELAQFTHDPLGFVHFAFPWGEDGELKRAKLETWQEEYLTKLGEDLRSGTTLEDSMRAMRVSTTSGHGVGKSALVSMLILWAISTHEDTIGVVTANTETQLKTKTWSQLAKWHRLFIGREYFKLTATSLFSVDPAHEKTWRIDMVPWSERNTEAFAGLHNKGKRIVLIYDEASAIPDVIWEVSEGALTDSDTEILWAVFGNPTRNQGRFKDCFPGGRFAHRWRNFIVDSRTVTLTDKKQIGEWISDYGEDSDFVRIRVRGLFPRADAVGFISYDVALEATRRDAIAAGPLILGVDVSRFGDDLTVVYPRRGLDAKSIKPIMWQGLDTMQTASKVAQLFLDLKAQMVMIDVGGVGAGVADRLRMLAIPLVEVDFGSSPDSPAADGTKYANKRAEIWGLLRNWLTSGAIENHRIDSDTYFLNELTAPTYTMDTKERILIESKKSMRARGVPSPNMADALACTFAAPVYAPSELREAQKGPVLYADYDPFTQERMH